MKLNSRASATVFCVAVIAICGCASGRALERTEPEIAPVRIPAPQPVRFVPFADTIQGVVVPDPLRWMEDTANVEVRAWMATHARYTDAVLRQLVGRDSIARRIERAVAEAPTLGKVVATPSRIILVRYVNDRPALYALDKGSRTERQILSNVAFARLGNGVALREITPSWDGGVVAIGLTAGGDANPAIILVDALSGGVLTDRIPDLLTTTSGTRYQVTWLPDGRGFFYPRTWPGSGDGSTADRFARGRHFLHRLGTPQSADIPVFGFGVSPSVPMDKDDLATRVTTAPDSKWMVGSVYRSKLSGTDYYAAPLAAAFAGAPRWARIATTDERLSLPQLRGDTLYALSRRNADRGRIVRRVLQAGSDPSVWETVVSERRGVITSFTVQQDAIYATEREAGGISLLRVPHAEKTPVKVDLPVSGTVRLAPTQQAMPGAVFSVESWATPPKWMRVNADSKSVEPMPFDDGSAAATTRGLISEVIEAPSRDGALVPVSLVYGNAALRNGRLDGTAPLLIDAYGAFGRSTDPSYNPFLQVWVEMGGIFAYAHVRGGGELGDAWRRAAVREHKQRSVDDMLAAIERLIAKRYTSPGRVVIMGISFGAIIPGLAMVQRPELFGAVLYEVGEPDEVRGARVNPTAARNIAEIGDLDTAEGVRLLVRWSPYHQVPERIKLPAVIVHSALQDYNFETAMLAGKYVARLQKANTSRRPVLWVRTPGGHAALFEMSPDWAATAVSFVLWQLGDPRFQPRRGAAAPMQ